ncbi:MAG: DNRLRE domain-containing protein [Ignavibacteria bacterium]|nr:DNRLRE domain-containing protein [Ignavibacteria bacterium]
MKFYIRALVLILGIGGLFVFQSCENNPNELGLEFILSDTLGTKVLDSNRDTMQITHNNYKKFINTSASADFFVGKTQGYESKALLKFDGLSSAYQGGTVLSATLKFHYAKYAFTDSMGSVSFNMYPLNTNYNFTTITNDSFSTGSIGSTLIGTYTGAPTNYNEIAIPFDAQTAKNWLEYAADTSYAAKNYGMILMPNASSNTIKGFSKSIDTLCPKLVIIVNKNNVTDTLTYSSIGNSGAVSLIDAPSSIYMADRIVLQNGVMFGDIINFNISKLPGRVTINQAYLKIKLDKANSITAYTNPGIYFAGVTDSVLKLSTGSITAIQEDSITYSVTLNSIFQSWNYGVVANLGVRLFNLSESVNLDKLVFFGPSVQDTAKRPKLIIRYTPRG